MGFAAVHAAPGDTATSMSESAGRTPPASTEDTELVGGGAADTPPLLSGWACDHHGTGRHSVFGSYRVATEGPADGFLSSSTSRAPTSFSMSLFPADPSLETR